NSIMRAVARLGEGHFPLYGRDAYEASRVDSFLDASLVFARGAQTYLLSLLDGSVSGETQTRAQDALATYLDGITRALLPERRFLVGDDVTLADICFVAELALFSNERARRDALERQGLSPALDGARGAPAYMRAFAHFDRLRMHPAFAPDVEPYLEKIDRRLREKPHDPDDRRVVETPLRPLSESLRRSSDAHDSIRHSRHSTVRTRRSTHTRRWHTN